MNPALAKEIEAGGWMYPWQLGGAELALLNPELQGIHLTREELIELPVRQALAASDAPTAVDLACNEGWFAHRLLEWGAARAIGLDVRAENIRRAVLVRDHLGVPAEKLTLRQEDLFAVDTAALGRFDVVLLLGLIYHVEDPVGALRRACALTGRLCAIDTQLTRHDAPIGHTWGTAQTLEYDEASFAARLEWDAEMSRVASSGGAMSLIPNRAAVELSLRAAGFSRTEWPAPQPHHDAQYRHGDRAVVLAFP
jgi:hypothetical protein